MTKQAVITIPYRNGELTLLVRFDGEFGSVSSYHDRELTEAAHYDRYDMVDIESESNFNSFVSKYSKKAIRIV